jgi:hypothetical protein
LFSPILLGAAEAAFCMIHLSVWVLFDFLGPFPAFSPIQIEPLFYRRCFLRSRIYQPDFPRPQLIANPDYQLTDN